MEKPNGLSWECKKNEKGVVMAIINRQDLIDFMLYAEYLQEKIDTLKMTVGEKIAGKVFSMCKNRGMDYHSTDNVCDWIRLACDETFSESEIKEKDEIEISKVKIGQTGAVGNSTNKSTNLIIRKAVIWAEIKSFEQEYQRLQNQINKLNEDKKTVSFKVQERLQESQGIAEQLHEIEYNNLTNES
jgi:hypothetical protein